MTVIDALIIEAKESFFGVQIGEGERRQLMIKNEGNLHAYESIYDSVVREFSGEDEIKRVCSSFNPDSIKRAYDNIISEKRMYHFAYKRLCTLAYKYLSGEKLEKIKNVLKLMSVPSRKVGLKNRFYITPKRYFFLVKVGDMLRLQRVIISEKDPRFCEYSKIDEVEFIKEIRDGI